MDSTNLNDRTMCARKVLKLAGDLGEWLKCVSETPAVGHGPSTFEETQQELRRRFYELVQAAVNCGPFITSPPAGWDDVAAIARNLATWVAEWEAKVKSDPSAKAWTWLADEWPDLRTFSWQGSLAIEAAQNPEETRKWDFLEARADNVQELQHPEEVASREFLANDRIKGQFAPWWHQRIAIAKYWSVNVPPAWDIIADALDILFSGTSNTFVEFSAQPHVQEQQLFAYLNRVHDLGPVELAKLTIEELAEILQRDCVERRGSNLVDCKKQSVPASERTTDGRNEPRTESGNSTVNSEGDDAWLAPSDIAKRCPLLNLDVINKRLIRWRRDHHDGWREVTERRPREAKYLYRWGSVRHLFDKSSDKSSERPAI